MSVDLANRIFPLLKDVERPSRYIGSEWLAGARDMDAEGASVSGSNAPDDACGTVCEDGSPLYSGDLRFCMIYPDTYELGQPNQAMRILVNAANRAPGIKAERAYLPAVDMIERMRASDIPLFSIDSMDAVGDFDVVGITLPHELAATNVLEVLDLAGIPVFAKDRNDGCPIIVGGGPCVYNPEPYAPFFDVLTIGEGEEATPETLLKIKELKGEGRSRSEILRALADIPGTYVPSLYKVRSAEDAQAEGSWVQPAMPGVPGQIVKRVYEGFATSDAWEPMVVPFMEIVHDRLNVEILRGCARGCRFCQAGMMYRPVRERSADNIVEAVRKGLDATGYEEVSLTSLSSTDHSQIREILTRLNDEYADSGVRISIPSQRLDSFGVDMAGLVAGRKKGGLTFAPEAGTQRLRDVINKNVTDDDLMDATREAFNAGWRRMKLYFMIGLPTECDEDLSGIADMANRTYELMRDIVPKDQRGSLSLGLSVNVFVPKAQTPFQWDGQISADEARRRVDVIRHNLRYKAISLSYHEPKTSFVEAVMSRGGREIADLVYEAWRRGARFDAWTEHFNMEAWREAADSLSIDVDGIAEGSYDSSYIMPWEHISCGVSRQYLEEERERAYSATPTNDCTMESCTSCGVCFDLNVKNELQASR